jgi:hypothetical protein
LEEGKKGLRRLSGRDAVRIFAIVAAVVLFAISPAFAEPNYTPVYAPPDGELNHAQILSKTYGGYFMKIGTSVNYGNASGIKAWRVYDYDGDDIKLNLLLGSKDDIDQVWTDGTAKVTAEVKYAGDSQSFGWNQGMLIDTYEELLTEDDINQPGISIDISGDFLWGYKPDGEEWWSMQSENDLLEDHMVTYQIVGLPDREVGEVVWLVFLEDRPLSVADKDYNDFVVEISAVPEPATAFLLVSGIALLLRKRQH